MYNYIKVEMTTKQKADIIKLIKSEYEKSKNNYNPSELYWTIRSILNNEIPIKLKGIRLLNIINDIIDIVPDIKVVTKSHIEDDDTYSAYKSVLPSLPSPLNISAFDMIKDNKKENKNSKPFTKSKTPEESIIGILYYDIDKPIPSDVLSDFVNDILFDYTGPIVANSVWNDDYNVYGIIFASRQLDFKFSERVFKETLDAVDESGDVDEIDIEFDADFDLLDDELFDDEPIGEDLSEDDLFKEIQDKLFNDDDFFNHLSASYLNHDTTIKYLENREPVNIRYTDDSGFFLWHVEAVSDSFCLACFPTQKEAEDYVELNGLPLRNIIDDSY